MYFFTADEHYGHKNIIRYTNRPFDTVEEMDETLIANHNKVVSEKDTIIHAGDFSFHNREDTEKIIKRLNGNHIFLKGCHDHWLRSGTLQIYRQMMNRIYITVCHYPMASWFASYHGSLHLHGHSHGKMLPIKNRLEIGVDANNYTPLSKEEVYEKIKIQNTMLETLSGNCVL